MPFLIVKEILIAKKEQMIDRGLNSQWIHCGGNET